MIDAHVYTHVYIYMCTYMLNLCVNVDEWVKWIVHVCLCVCAAHVHTVSISVRTKYKERHVLYIFAQMFQTTKMCSCSNKCSLPQSRCWLTLMRAVCEKYTSKWAFENMSNTCSHWQSLKSWTLKKRLSYQPHYLIFNSFLLCAQYFSEHMMYVNLFIIKLLRSCLC